MNAPDEAAVIVRLAEVRRLVGEVAARNNVEHQLAGLARAALDVTRFACGQVYTYEDGLWTGHGGAQCDGSDACPVCNTDPRFTAFADRTIILDKVSDPGRQLLHDTPEALAKVLVTPVVVGPGRRTVLVLRTDDHDLEVDPLTLELVHTLTAQSALAIEHARARAAEAQLVSDVEASTRRASEFVQVLSHDLRGPLGTIASAARLLQTRGDQLDERQRGDLVATLERQSSRLSRVVEDVALAVLGDNQGLALQPTEVVVLDVLRDEAARVEASDRTREVAFTCDPALMMRADATRVAQVVQHLVDNAIRYGPHGGPVRLTAQVVGPKVAIDVHDGGTGIDATTRDVMFERFGRGLTIPDGVKGAGLGLYIARRFARAMDGEVVLVSSDAGGTLFRLTVPGVLDSEADVRP